MSVLMALAPNRGAQRSGSASRPPRSSCERCAGSRCGRSGSDGTRDLSSTRALSFYSRQCSFLRPSLLGGEGVHFGTERRCLGWSEPIPLFSVVSAVLRRTWAVYRVAAREPEQIVAGRKNIDRLPHHRPIHGCGLLSEGGSDCCERNAGGGACIVYKVSSDTALAVLVCQQLSRTSRQAILVTYVHPHGIARGWVGVERHVVRKCLVLGDSVHIPATR